MPINFGDVDEESDRWVKTVKSNFLCIATAVPQNQREQSRPEDTVLVEQNCAVQQGKIGLLDLC